eukprot:m51a1_g6314 hypothetical protein (98) ;mRNA; r:335240-335802
MESGPEQAHPAANKAGGMRVKPPHHGRNGSSPPRGVLASAVEMGPDLVVGLEGEPAEAHQVARNDYATRESKRREPTREMPRRASGSQGIPIMQPRK